MLLVASETTYTNEILQFYHTLATIVVAIANNYFNFLEGIKVGNPRCPPLY